MQFGRSFKRVNPEGLEAGRAPGQALDDQTMKAALERHHCGCLELASGRSRCGRFAMSSGETTSGAMRRMYGRLESARESLGSRRFRHPRFRCLAAYDSCGTPRIRKTRRTAPQHSIGTPGCVSAKEKLRDFVDME
jgi:hypothetical protein